MVSSSLPSISAMVPTFVREPFHRSGWVYERKAESCRTVC